MSFKSQNKILFFGGSFDPIHLGHLSLAIQVQEKMQFDQVLFCPNYCSPLKVKTPPSASAEHRLKMVELAIRPLKNFAVTDMEMQKKTACYTVDTLAELIQKKPHSKLFFLMAEGPALEFFQWKDAEKILQLATPIIGSREKKPFRVQEEIPEAFQKAFISTNIMEISATDIRERFKKKLYCGHLLPQIILDYITKHDLY